MKNGTTATLTQREETALYTALDRGYFDVPRRISLSALATALDTTDVELQERLHVGTASLLASYRDTSESAPNDP